MTHDYDFVYPAPGLARPPRTVRVHYRGREYKIVHAGRELEVGDTVTDFRGDTYRFRGFRVLPPPSSGRIDVYAADNRSVEYYPSGFGCAIVPAEAILEDQPCPTTP